MSIYLSVYVAKAADQSYCQVLAFHGLKRHLSIKCRYLVFRSGVTNPKVSGVHDQIQPEKKSHYGWPLRTCTLESANNPVGRTSNERVKW